MFYLLIANCTQDQLRERSFGRRSKQEEKNKLVNGGVYHCRYEELKVAWNKAENDGLTTLKYTTASYEEKPLHTVISVSLHRS